MITNASLIYKPIHQIPSKQILPTRRRAGRALHAAGADRRVAEGEPAGVRLAGREEDRKEGARERQGEDVRRAAGQPAGGLLRV